MGSKKYYTMTMARVYADQGYFDKAREIIHLLDGGDSCAVPPELNDILTEKIDQDLDTYPEGRLNSLMEQWVNLIYSKKRLAGIKKKWK